MKPKNNSKDSKRDRCQTPPYAVDILLPYLSMYATRLMKREGNFSRSFNVWEPAAGKGYLVAKLIGSHFEVQAGDVHMGLDYFTYEAVGYDMQVTNPPFSLKYKWLERAYLLGKPFALLMPSDVYFAATAVKLFNRFGGIELISPDKRIDYEMPDKGWGTKDNPGSAQFHSSWFTYGLDIGREVTRVTMEKVKMYDV